MNDLRSEVVDILAKMKFFQGQRGGRELWNDKPFEVQGKDLESFNKGIEKIRKYILQLEEQPKVNEWIPVEERLPECEWGCETEAILFQLKSSSIEVGYYGTGGKYRDRYFRTYRDDMEGFDAIDVVAWMPLPAPYDMRKKVE